MLPKILKTILTIMMAWFVLFYLVKADIYLGSQGRLPVAPSTLFVGASLPVIGLVLLALLRENRFASLLYRCRSVMIAFLTLVVVSLFGVLLRTVAASPSGPQLFFPVLDFYVFLAGVVFAAIIGSRMLWRLIAWVGLGIIVGTIFVDVIRPYTFTLRELVGPAGLPQNPNGGAYAAVLLLTAALDWQKHRVSWWDGGLMAAALAAIFVTASRSGILLSVPVVLLYFYRARKSFHLGSLFTFVLLGLAASVLAGSGVYTALDSLPIFANQSSKINQLFNLGGETLSFRDVSAVARIDAFQESVALIDENPLLGQGTGVSYEMRVGPHNMYLARWVDNGILGLASYLGLLASAALLNIRYRNFEGVVLTLLMTLMGLFSHNVLEDRTMLLLLSISTTTAVHGYLRERAGALSARSSPGMQTI